MRLFFDEDQGSGVAVALRAVGVTSYYVGPGQRIEKGMPDERWIPIAGGEGLLVISSNREILRNPVQRALWIEHSVGGVFFTTNRLRAIGRLRLLLRKLDWLERID